MGNLTAFGRNAVLQSGLPATLYVEAHSADPTDAGTVAKLTGVARVAVPFAAASGGQKVPSAGTYEFDVLAGQTIAWVAYFDASSNGNCYAVDQLDAAETFTGNGKYTLTTQAISIN